MISKKPFKGRKGHVSGFNLHRTSYFDILAFVFLWPHAMKV